MDKRKIRPICMAFIVSLLTFSISFVSACFSQDEYSSEVKSVIEDIRVINLLNGLDLREEQMEFILQEAEKVSQIRDDSYNNIYSRTHQMADVCNTIKEEVEQGKVKLDRVVARNFIEIKDQLEGLNKATYAKVEDSALRIEAILELFQLEALDSYKPCIIPIVSNGRIGQAGGGEGFIKLLERVKEITETRFYERSQDIINHIVERAKERLPIGVEFDEQAVRLKILDTFNKVRNMEDVDFQVNKQALAEELKAIILPEREVSRKTKIMKFLLSENIIPILKDRLNN